MERTCTKEFTVTIAEPASAVTLFAYYTCDANPNVDPVSGRNLTPAEIPPGSGIFPPPIAAAGIIGSSFQSDPSGSSPPGWRMQHFPGVGTTDWNFAGEDWTMRFWHYMPTTSTVDAGAFIGTNEWGVRQSTGGPGIYRFFVTDVFSGINYVNCLDVLSAGWHRVIAWHQNGGPSRIKIDNNAEYSNGLAVPQKSTNGMRFVINGTAFSTFRIDEVAIWKGILTDAEMLSDWNGGAGKTYPNVPGI